MPPREDPLLSDAAAAAARARTNRRASNTKRPPIDDTAPDPKKEEPKSRTRSSSAPKTTLNPDGKRTPKWSKLEQQLTEMYSAIALPFAAFGDQFCANHIAGNAEALASSWVDLAQQNPNVEKVLNSLVTGGAWGGVIMTHAMVALPVAAHHNLIPGPAGQRIGMMFGITPNSDPTQNGQGAGHNHN